MLRNEPVQPWAERTVPPASSPSQIHWLQLRDWSGDDTEEWTGVRNQGGKGTEPD